ncbi:MAG: phosphate/phosphite/phosphonate ABC transporter substrate-binding protein [Defluviitaleaceae bacterium]|nr:phosphate/phosphite/phosphonate ABC transporter substrate-binding protein [Defluviitaleaceae bacterium]
MKKVLLAVFLLVMVAVLGACGRGDDETVQSIRIGLTVDMSNPVDGLAASRAMAQALGDFLGMPVVMYEDINYLIGTEAMRGGHLDIMLVSAFNYIHTSAAVDVEMLVSLPIRPGTVNNSVFIVCATNEDIFAAEDMRGRTAAFVSPTSTSGFIFPVYYLVSTLGINPDLITNPGYFFDTVLFTQRHETNVDGVLLGDFDVAGIGGMFIENMVERGELESADAVRIIAATDPVPNPAYIIRSALDDDLIERIREFFLTFDDPAYFAENWGDSNIRFTAPDLAGFAYVRSVVTTLGLD